MAYVSVKDLSVTYRSRSGTVQALSSLSLEVEQGEVCAVVGPSGCGKSTLLNVLAGITSAYQGQVLIDGTRPGAARHNTGLIPQSYGLLPWKKVEDNVMLAVRLRGGSADSRRMQEVMDMLGIGHLGKRYPGELSGGQKQRVALARVLLQQPALLLMDEPFSALDTIMARRSRTLVADVLRRGITTIVITHNMDEAVFLADKVAVMSPSPGTLLSVSANPWKGFDGSDAARDGFVSSLYAMIREGIQ